jgi:hypothetical protein
LFDALERAGSRLPGFERYDDVAHHADLRAMTSGVRAAAATATETVRRVEILRAQPSHELAVIRAADQVYAEPAEASRRVRQPKV